MSQTASPCAVDAFLEALSESDRNTFRPLSEMLGLRHAFVIREPGAAGGLEATFLSPRHLVPVRQLEGGRLDLRVIPLALVLTVAFREEPDGIECQLELYQSSPIVLRWPGATLATAAEDKAFRLLMTTCGFASHVPEPTGRPGFRSV
jgi:hypothetical protein